VKVPGERRAPSLCLSVALGRECLPRGRRNYRMFWAQKEGCGIEANCFSLLGRLWNRNVYFFGDVKQLALIISSKF